MYYVATLHPLKSRKIASKCKLPRGRVKEEGS
uniref:Uncharacterized protein n=1 Tax=Anguilla anguilla TaxID=7936 RepID=A0A0E9WH74_ANGAN